VMPDPVLCVQSALLYTNSDGERRIRVNTWAGLTTQNYTDIIGSIDVQATVAMMSHIVLEQSLQANLSEGRSRLHSQCQQIVQAGNVYPNVEALQFLPLYIMGMLKSPAFLATNDINFDMRTYLWTRLETICVSQMAAYYYPRLMALHNVPNHCATPDEHGRSTLPDMLNLTEESITQDGVFLLEDGETMQMWIGRNVDVSFLQTIFGTSDFDSLDSANAGSIEETLATRNDSLSTTIHNVIRQVRSERPVPHMQLQVIRQGEPKERRFRASLIEDRTFGLQSTYTEFIQRMGYRPPQTQAPPQQMQPGQPGQMMPGPMSGPLR